jgi:hypothetical protein
MLGLGAGVIGGYVGPSNRLDEAKADFADANQDEEIIWN